MTCTEGGTDEARSRLEARLQLAVGRAAMGEQVVGRCAPLDPGSDRILCS